MPHPTRIFVCEGCKPFGEFEAIMLGFTGYVRSCDRCGKDVDPAKEGYHWLQRSKWQKWLDAVTRLR